MLTLTGIEPTFGQGPLAEVLERWRRGDRHTVEEWLALLGLAERGELTEAGRALASVLAGVRRRPRYDRQRRVLHWGESVVLEIRKAAENQEAVLTAFEDAGWPACVPNPLKPRPPLPNSVRLNDTVKALQRKRRIGAIAFRCDGSGGVVWEAVGEQ